MAGIHKLSAAFVRTAPVGKHGDGAGLWLIKRADGGAQWVLRVTIHGRRREMGLGRYPDVNLKSAREMAVKWRGFAADGIDPIKQREKERREAARQNFTLNDVTRETFEARKAELKNDGKAGRWMSPLEIHVLPKIGKVPVSDIDQLDIRQVLAPIWHSKADTARKAMNRLGLVLKHAAAMGLDVDLQATEKAKALLGKSRHISKNVPALDWQDVPEFYQSLTAENSITHLALRLLILTGMRSAPVRFAHFDQIENGVWHIPSTVMKTGQDFRVPLSHEAQNVLDLARPFTRDGHLFPSVRRGVISDATMARLMERRGMEARPHGFRSSLRTWIAECTNASREVAETILAHSVGSSVERAYRRTDFLEQRQKLLEQWANHVTGSHTENVVSISGSTHG